jgi:hypothetical protein
LNKKIKAEFFLKCCKRKTKNKLKRKREKENRKKEKGKRTKKKNEKKIADQVGANGPAHTARGVCGAVQAPT